MFLTGTCATNMVIMYWFKMADPNDDPIFLTLNSAALISSAFFAHLSAFGPPSPLFFSLVFCAA